MPHTFAYDCREHGEYEASTHKGATCPTCNQQGRRLWKATPLASTCHPSKGAGK